MLRLDSGHARARERLAEAERRTGEALFARWLPNREPSLALFEPEAEVLESPTILLQGIATDDRGIQKVEFRVGGRVVGEFLPAGSPRGPGAQRPSSPGPCPSSPASTRSW